MNVTFYFDFLSPYAYLAQHRMDMLRNEHRFKIDYRAIDLIAAKRAIGNTGPGNRDLPTKLAYISKDLDRWAKLYGIPLHFPKNYNSGPLNRGLYFDQARGVESDYIRCAYELVWGEGRSPDASETLSAVARRMGWNERQFTNFTESALATQKYTEVTQEAISRQVFGVPTMVIGDEMWWGNDRLFFLESYLNGDKNDE